MSESRWLKSCRRHRWPRSCVTLACRLSGPINFWRTSGEAGNTGCPHSSPERVIEISTAGSTFIFSPVAADAGSGRRMAAGKTRATPVPSDSRRRFSVKPAFSQASACTFCKTLPCPAGFPHPTWPRTLAHVTPRRNRNLLQLGRSHFRVLWRLGYLYPCSVARYLRAWRARSRDRAVAAVRYSAHCLPGSGDDDAQLSGELGAVQVAQFAEQSAGQVGFRPGVPRRVYNACSSGVKWEGCKVPWQDPLSP